MISMTVISCCQDTDKQNELGKKSQNELSFAKKRENPRFCILSWSSWKYETSIENDLHIL